MTTNEKGIILFLTICAFLGFLITRSEYKKEQACVKLETHYFYIVGMAFVDGGSDLNKARNMAGLTALTPRLVCSEYNFKK